LTGCSVTLYQLFSASAVDLSQHCSWPVVVVIVVVVCGQLYQSLKSLVTYMSILSMCTYPRARQFQKV